MRRRRRLAAQYVEGAARAVQTRAAPLFGSFAVWPMTVGSGAPTNARTPPIKACHGVGATHLARHGQIGRCPAGKTVRRSSPAGCFRRQHFDGGKVTHVNRADAGHPPENVACGRSAGYWSRDACAARLGPELFACCQQVAADAPPPTREQIALVGRLFEIAAQRIAAREDVRHDGDKSADVHVVTREPARPADSAQRFIRADELADQLGIEPRWLEERCAPSWPEEDRLPHHRFGRALRFSPEDRTAIEDRFAVGPHPTRAEPPAEIDLGKALAGLRRLRQLQGREVGPKQ